MNQSAQANTSEAVDVMLLTPSLGDNSLGRTYCLWMLARAAGLSTQVVALEGGDIWYPLEGSEFAHNCEVLPSGDRRTSDARAPRLIIGIKPMPTTIKVLSELSHRYGAPSFIDVDDPDLEMRIPSGWSRQRATTEVREFRAMLRLRLCRRYAYRHTGLVSNPELERLYGGVVIPHVRRTIPAGVPHESTRPRVAFIGTSRPHKGISVLRAAVAELATQGFTLTITGTAPPDARPWEDWVGETTLDRGIELVQKSDIVVTPSLVHAQGQFPVKLVDAMLAARPVVVSDIPPLPWVVGPAGRCTTPGSVPSLVNALRPLVSPGLRTSLGESLRQRALEEFTVDSQKDKFERVCISAMRMRGNDDSERAEHPIYAPQ